MERFVDLFMKMDLHLSDFREMRLMSKGDLDIAYSAESADSGPTVGRQWADSGPTVGRQWADSRPTVGNVSVTCR